MEQYWSAHCGIRLAEMARAAVPWLTRVRGERAKELRQLSDIFGDAKELARYYVEPKCQHHNPADRHEDLHPVSQVRAPAFGVINDFLNGDVPLRGGRTQMFILSDAGMGKTSLLMMLKLAHLTAFWPRGYDCLLLKLGEDTLDTVKRHKDKAHTLLLLDALDEDPLAWGNIEARLMAILKATEHFRRVIVSCRTQFFPETGADPFGNPGRVEVGGYICPMMFLSLFDENQVAAYLRKRLAVALVRPQDLRQPNASHPSRVRRDLHAVAAFSAPAAGPCARHPRRGEQGVERLQAL